jgi:hypothetical protein
MVGGQCWAYVGIQLCGPCWRLRRTKNDDKIKSFKKATEKMENNKN